MLKRTALVCAMDARVKQQYLEFMLVFASEFRNLPVHFGYQKSSQSANTSNNNNNNNSSDSSNSNSVVNASTTPSSAPSSTSSSPAAYVAQRRFFLRLEPDHPGHAWLRSHGHLLELDALPSKTSPDGVSSSPTPSSSSSSSSSWREKIHVYTSLHRVKATTENENGESLVNTTAPRSSEATITCYTYVFPTYELVEPEQTNTQISSSPSRGSSTAAEVPAEVLWWCNVQRHVLDPLLPLHWRNNDPWLGALYSYTSSHRDVSSSLLALSPASREALEKAVMDANNTVTFRARVQQRFYQNACLTPGGDEVKRALARGRLEIRQLKEVAHVRKFRAMRKRYEWSTVRQPGTGAAGTAEEQWWLGLENRDSYGYNELETAAVTES